MFLEKVVAVKREEVLKRKSLFPWKEMEEAIALLPPPRDFQGAFSPNGPLALIAEFKRASPSAGMIRENAGLRKMAGQYQAGGAGAISVLTEANFFKGALEDLGQVKEEVFLPVLQKDFVIDSFQIYEGRMAGADAILLIAAILERDQLSELVKLTQSLEMAPLVEVHNQEDLEKVRGFGLPVIGINNRDLKTLAVDLTTTLRLREKIPPGTKVVSESGIKGRKDVEHLQGVGVHGILVGEILMRAPDPAAKIKELLGL